MSISPDARISLLDSFGGASASADGIRGQVPAPSAGDQGKFLRGDGTWAVVTATSGGSGTVTYVDVSGGLTGLTFSGGPVTASGVITASGAVVASAGGTGRTSYTTGDILFASGGTSLGVIPIGASGQILMASGGIGAWTTASASTWGAVPTTRSIFASGALTGGGTLAADVTISLASIVAPLTVGSASTVPVITFDTYGRITLATNAAISASAGTTVNTAQGTVDFGFQTGDEGDIATVTISAPWVLASSIIICSPAAVTTADHDPDDYAAEGITSYVANLASGVGFDIVAAAPNNTFGQYVINAHGV